MKKKIIERGFLLTAFVFIMAGGYGQKKGNLFIIGGGERTPELMKELIITADPAAGDYFVVLTMATSEPEESYEFLYSQLSALCKNKITGFNFTKSQANDQTNWIDSVRHAKLIYIVGGDQNRFMDVVRGSALYHAMHDAYKNGATISGTSAGAAVMSQIMITGEEKDKTDKGGFKDIKKDNAVTAQGMGFIINAIVDQHFIKRSRFNRLLSVLSDHPDKMVIGIDESTAIIVTGNKVRVTGESGVVVISNPKKIRISGKGMVAFKNARLSLFTQGDHFKLK
ncbi:MAG: cyanophycinase [Ginsengibacter sp.]